MLRFLCTGVVALLLTHISVPNVEAAVSARDWKASGDGLLTYDDANQREWLDLSVSRLSDFPGSTLEQQYQSAILELEVGGNFEGFVVAKTADVINLGQSAGIDTASSDFMINQSSASSLIDLLGSTVALSNGHKWSFGLLDEIIWFAPFPERLSALVNFNPAAGSVFARAGMSVGVQDPATYPNVGVMLYRNVPEPTAIALWVIVASSFTMIRILSRPRRVLVINSCPLEKSSSQVHQQDARVSTPIHAYLNLNRPRRV